MNYDQLYRQIRLKPHGWRWFGPYWFNVKMALRERGYTDLGDHDDPELRRIMAATTKTELGLMRKAKRCYEENFGTYQDGNVKLPDGSNRYLSDPDMDFVAPLEV